MAKERDPRVKQVAAAAAILSLLTAVVCGVLLGWRLVPGVLGEWMGTIVGVMSTPFLLEASFVFMGFTIIFWLNHRRQKRRGQELVFLDDTGKPESPAGCRDDSSSIH